MKFNKLRTVIIDDSDVQRAALIHLIENHPNLVLMGEYHNGINARPHIKNKDIDLVFLDIEMPVVNGFELLESLEKIPQIIIGTGNPNYALKAFDHNVTDYLLKPIKKDRFNESIKRALINHSHAEEFKDESEYIYVNSDLKKTKVYLNAIQWIEGMGDYIRIITDDNDILVLSTMKSFLTRLPESKFLRIHKSYIVNLAKVEKFNTAIVEVVGKQLPLSRHRKIELEKALIDSKF